MVSSSEVLERHVCLYFFKSEDLIHTERHGVIQCKTQSLMGLQHYKVISKTSAVYFKEGKTQNTELNESIFLLMFSGMTSLWMSLTTVIFCM